MIIPVGKVQELKHIFVKQKDFCFLMSLIPMPILSLNHRISKVR